MGRNPITQPWWALGGGQWSPPAPAERASQAPSGIAQEVAGGDP